MTRSGSGPLPASLARLLPSHCVGPIQYPLAVPPASSTYAPGVRGAYAVAVSMPGLRRFRALHPVAHDLMTAHIRNALRDHHAPEDFLSLMVLDTSERAPPLGAILYAMLHADASHPPLRVFAAMTPLLVEGVQSEIALHHRIDRLPRVSAFLALTATHLPQLDMEVHRGARALLPLAAQFADGPQRAVARAVASQLTDMISGGRFPRGRRPYSIRHAA